MRRTSQWFLILAITLGLFMPAAVTPAQAAATPVFINEIHYDNDGTDSGEAIEIAGPAGTDLTGWSLVLYNGSTGAVYDTDALSGTIPDQQSGYGTVVMTYPVNGIQNGSPDGVALVNPSSVVIQFLSYEGTFTAVGGPADGIASVDIGVSEPGTTPVGHSLQLSGTGTVYEDFTWSAPAANTFGTINTGQTFGATQAGPKINEFSASTAGTDVEFVEVYGEPNTDYLAYTILEIEGDSGASVGTIDEVIAVGTTDAAGIWLANLAANALENGTITLLLVKDFTGTLNTDLDMDNNGVFDAPPWSEIVDAVAVNDGGTGDVTYGTPTLGVSYDGLTYAPGGASRIPDGFDTDAATDWVRNDFDLAGIPGYDGSPEVGEARNTPGAPNEVVVPPAPQLVINEIDYDQPGTDTAEFVEIRNNGASAVSLNGWTLELVNGNGGGAAIYTTITLPDVSLPGGDFFVVCANAATVANCDLDASPNTDFIQNGAPDAVGLRFNGNLIDAVSYEGNTGAPYVEVSGVGLEDPGTTGSDNRGLSRCPDGHDTNVNNVDLVLSAITPGSANCTAEDAAPAVTATYPANGATDFPIKANLTISFSEPVDVADGWFALSCATSGAVSAAVSGGPDSYVLDPAVDLVSGESCTLTIYASNVTDQDANDPPDNLLNDVVLSFTPYDVCAQPFTPIYEIQGSGAEAAITGSVTTKGVVVGDYEGPSPTLRGFYLQDLTGDGDTATSDGIFVYNASYNNVNVGDLVRVTGTASEYQGQTQINTTAAPIACGTGTVVPVDVTLPLPSLDDLERYEGMLVRLPQTLYVTEHYQLGRFGQVVLSSGGRLMQPTNIYAPGAEAAALQDANNLNRIIVDDALNNQNPDPIVFARDGMPLSASNTLRGGDTATGIVGVMTYTWGGNSVSPNAYRVRPINALTGYFNFEAANSRPEAAPELSGTLRVAGMNLLNFFNTFDGLPDSVDNCTYGVGGLPTDCRGADTQAEFDRQWPKTVAAIVGTNADVVGLVELENDGYGADSALQILVDKLNAVAGEGVYALIDADAGTGQVNALGTDAIKVGLIYKPAKVTPIGTTAALNTVEFVNGGDTEARNRPALAQAFEEVATGGRFVVAVNHLKSKSCPGDGSNADQGDGQGCWNDVRTNAANLLWSWLEGDPTQISDTDALIIGDLNSYAKEDPIEALKAAGYSDLKLLFESWEAYSYVFDGQWGYLDHALSSYSLTPQVAAVFDWHINADEPSVLDYNTDFKSADQMISLYAPDEFRISDHDPVLIDLNVCDEIPPTLEVTVDPAMLWPVNHKYVDVVATVTAADNFDPNPTVTLVSVTSNEPDDGLGDGDTPIDIVIVDDYTFKLRAERAGTGMDRIYTITYQVTDACGNSTLASVMVTVPHDKGQ